MKLFVIIPMFNEAPLIAQTLNRLCEQTDRDFDVVVCDNGSTDESKAVTARFIADRDLPWTIVDETRKGTGAAADTAARHAIRLGATHLARTDADSLPDVNWVAAIKRAFTVDGHRFVAGLTHPRTDDLDLSWLRAATLRRMNDVAIIFGQLRPSNRGPQFRGPYLMAPGNNLAIDADLYEECGGFTRTAIEEAHEDRNLVQALRQLTADYGLHREVIVYTSARRVQAWGIAKSLRWYAGHHFNPEKVDIR